MTVGHHPLPRLALTPTATTPRPKGTRHPVPGPVRREVALRSSLVPQTLCVSAGRRQLREVNFPNFRGTKRETDVCR